MAVRRLRIASGGVLLLAALAVGVLTAVLTATWLGSQPDDGTAPSDAPALAPTITVVAIRSDIPAGTALSAPLLREMEIAPDTALAGVYTNSNRLVSRVTRYPLQASEQVVESKLVPTEGAQGTGLAYSVPEGMRAVSVPFSEVMGAGGLVVPGDHVDILVHTKNERLFGPGDVVPEGEEGRPTVVTVLQDVLVLAVGIRRSRPRHAATRERRGPTRRPLGDARRHPGAGAAHVLREPGGHAGPGHARVRRRLALRAEPRIQAGDRARERPGPASHALIARKRQEAAGWPGISAR